MLSMMKKLEVPRSWASSTSGDPAIARNTSGGMLSRVISCSPRAISARTVGTAIEYLRRTISGAPGANA